MESEKYLCQISKELGLNFETDSIETMIKLLEEGMSPENLVKMLREILAEKSGSNLSEI